MVFTIKSIHELKFQWKNFGLMPILIIVINKNIKIKVSPYTQNAKVPIRWFRKNVVSKILIERHHQARANIIKRICLNLCVPSYSRIRQNLVYMIHETWKKFKRRTILQLSSQLCISIDFLIFSFQSSKLTSIPYCRM